MIRATTLIRTLLFSTLLMAQSVLADYVNSIGMVLTDIPAGSFYMGSCKLSYADVKANKQRKFLGLDPNIACPFAGTNDNDATSDETPRHKVHISKGFQMAIHEVTVKQFKQFIIATGRSDLLTDSFINYNRHADNSAVTVVSWRDAQAFIKWLNNKEGGNAYRLPTEAEWEYAARAGSYSIYSWGNSTEAQDYAWYAKNAKSAGKRYAQPVGSKLANPWGLYDMHGNVWEWVQDGYDEDYYRNSPTQNPLKRNSGMRVFRGGSWKNEVWFMRSGDRAHARPDLRGSNLGFRLVRQL